MAVGIVGADLLIDRPVAAGICAAPTMACGKIAELMKEPEGYGREAKGGLGGNFVTVTSNLDTGPGTLRDIAEHALGPVWIVFANDMTIDLLSQINVESNVTIDGRGHFITLHDWGLTISGRQNVIVTHIAVDGRFRADSQAVNISGSQEVWLDHLTLSRTNDRLVNVKNGSTDVTLSWIRFEQHNKVMLFNNLVSEDLFKFYDRDSKLRVTLHHSYFVDTVQRNPRAQMGTSHIYDNLFEDWDFYGMSFSLEHRALIEGNIFINKANRPCTEPPHFDTVEHVPQNYCASIPAAPARTALPNGDADRDEYEKTKAKYAYTHDWRAFLKVRNNLYLGDAKPVLDDYQPDRVPTPDYCYSYETPSAALVAEIRAGAGNLGRTMPSVKRTCPPGVTATDPRS